MASCVGADPARAARCDQLDIYSTGRCGMVLRTVTCDRPFISDSNAAVTPRRAQTDNDASGNPQRVAGRLPRTAPTESQPGDKRIHGLWPRVGAEPARAARCDQLDIYSTGRCGMVLRTETCDRPFISDSDAAVTPQRAQTDNDASGNPQRVAGRLYRTAPTESQLGDKRIHGLWPRV